MAWYTGHSTYDTWLLVGFALALLIFISSYFGTAQYGGRFGESRTRWRLSSKAGWILMEMPALIFFPLFFFMGSNAGAAVPLFFLALWTFHYCNRALVTPFLMRASAQTKNSFAPSVVVLGWVILALHAYLNATYISELGAHYQTAWFGDPRFIIGIIIYICGFVLNMHSDSILRNLRSKNPKPDDPRYKIPYGGGFRFVSCPQYLGEIVSFCGIAIMTWNFGAVFVIAISVGNLAPRALLIHQWFNQNFDDYPKERKAILPFVL